MALSPPAARRTQQSGWSVDQCHRWLRPELLRRGLVSATAALAVGIGLAVPATAAPIPLPSPSASAPDKAPAPDKALAPFVPTDELEPAGPPGLVKERAAQRDEELAKAAEDISRSAQEASTTARDEGLTVAQGARQEAAVRLAEENRRLATAAREAAARNTRIDGSGSGTANGTTDQAGTPATPPAGEATAPDVTSIPTGGAGVSPVPGAIIGAHFGQYGSWSRYHTGIDFRARTGTPIRAVKAGVVTYSGNRGDWAGNHVAVQHGDGMTTMSSHMSAISVSAGQTVSAGQIIGYVGSTGRSFGPHLHFELYPAGVRPGDVYRAINPQSWLVSNGVNAR